MKIKYGDKYKERREENMQVNRWVNRVTKTERKTKLYKYTQGCLYDKKQVESITAGKTISKVGNELKIEDNTGEKQGKIFLKYEIIKSETENTYKQTTDKEVQETYSVSETYEIKSKP